MFKIFCLKSFANWAFVSLFKLHLLVKNLSFDTMNLLILCIQCGNTYTISVTQMHLQQLLHSCLVWGHLPSSHRSCLQHPQETEDLMLPCWFYGPGRKILLDKFFIGLGMWQGKTAASIAEAI